MKSPKNTFTPLKSEEAMIQGILEGSPDAVGVVVVRLACGCRKMAAVDKAGEPASKVIMFRHKAESICDLCKKDNGAYARVETSFIHWVPPGPAQEMKQMIERKALGTSSH